MRNREKLAQVSAAAGLMLVLAAPVLGQERPSPPAGFLQGEEANGWRASKLIGASVYGPDNASIGEIAEVLIDTEGKVRAVVVGVGSFLGLAEKNVAIPFSALTITPGAANGAIDKVAVKFSKQQLQEAPNFAFEQLTRPQTTGTGAVRAPERR
jgi:sporulation protein YlmC with PRC-barrel domain